jgi:Flp pilus assembly protein TadD
MPDLEPIDILYDEAIAKHRSGDTEAAIEMLRQLLAESPNYSLAHNALSVLYSRLGKIDQAVEHAKRVCEIDPDDTFGYTILSTLCLKNGRREEAEDALMKANQLSRAAWLKNMQEGARGEG